MKKGFTKYMSAVVISMFSNEIKAWLKWLHKDGRESVENICANSCQNKMNPNLTMVMDKYEIWLFSYIFNIHIPDILY